MKEKSKFTKEYIQEQIRKDDRWVVRSLQVLFQRQTTDEQRIGHTTEHNSRGFSGCDGTYLSYCAKWVNGGRPLTGIHIEKCRNKLVKYWKQIKEEIDLKESI